MNFDPVSSRLYTDSGTLIKQLHCPYGMSWDNMSATGEDTVRLCDICKQGIVDTAGLRDDAVLQLVQHNPATCLKVSLDQDNLRVIYAHAPQ